MPSKTFRKGSRKTGGPGPKRKRRKRPYTRDKAAHLRRRVQKSEPHRRAMRKQTESLNYLLHQLLKTASSTEQNPYNYHPRHHSKDPEYAFSSARQQRFKRDVPAPDTHSWRPQGDDLPPYPANFPRWGHPHAGII